MPTLPDSDPNPLITLFRQCVVRVTDEAGGFLGSGFFVAPGQVLTCGHVVHGAAAPQVRWQEKVAAVGEVAAMPPLESVPDPRGYPLPDLAVLGVEGTSEWGHPCVALSVDPPVLGASTDGLYLAGYTIEHGRVPALTGATTEFESLITEQEHTFYKLKRGQLLPGFSGSPLLDVRAGMAVGIVESSRGRQADLGGFAVPAAELAAAFPEVLEANRTFHSLDPGWQAAVEAERVRARERDGGRGRIPLRRPVIPLAADEGLSPATILRPRHAVVDYVGREQLLAELAAWCELEPEDGDPTRLWFVTGGGGFGKTRLAVEACREAEARGWTAGLLTSDDPGSKLQALAEWPGRLLIAVDYAEARPALIGRLAEEFAARAPRPAVRIMLLVRRRSSRADLLSLFNERRDDELGALLRHAGISRLEEADSEVNRLDLFRQGVEDFAPFVSTPLTEMRSPRLRADHFVRPLYVLTAAYLARASADTDVDALSEADLLRTLLDEHEAAHWDRWDKRRRLGLDPADQRTAVAIATLLSADGEEEALTVTRLIPHFGAVPEPRLMEIARWLSQLYPPPAANGQLVIAPLEPDRLGEVLVGDELKKHSELLAAAIDVASDRQLIQALTVVSRTAREDESVNAQLRAVLEDRLSDLFERAFSVGRNDLLNAVIAAMTISRPVRGAAEASDRFPTMLPVWASSLSAAVTALAVDGFRVLASDDPASVPDLARLLNNLATRLNDIGQRQEALEIAREAVTHYRQLASDNPAGHLANLAAALYNLASTLGQLTLWEEALDIAREAVTHYRQLASDESGYLPNLAAALTITASFLSQVGQRQEGLDTAREAVACYQELGRDNPAHLPNLAALLANLAGFLSEAGQRQEALDTAREAVIHYRQLASDESGYLPNLAAALNNLSGQLSGADQPREALEASREAVTHYRQLATDNPTAHLSHLATSLNNLASDLSKIGQWQEALNAAREALAIRRELARGNSAVHLPALAAAVANLALILGQLGRRQEALQIAREAVTHYRQLAGDNPTAYLSNLATSLNNLASVLSQLGQRLEALETAREALTLYRQLASDNPAYHPNLATALYNFASRLGDVGQTQEALETAREAVTLYRQLAADNPTAHLPDLALSLNNVATRLSEADQPQEALDTARETVTRYRQLASDNPTAHVPHLAAALNNFASRLSEAGQPQEALDTAREALTHHRQLATDNPAAHLPSLAISLGNLASYLSDAGEADQAEALFGDILDDFTDSPGGTGYALLTRGRWRAQHDRMAEAIRDATAALSAFDRDDDRVARGQARQLLCMLRASDEAVFDQAWEEANEPLPVWLMYPASDQEVGDEILAWVYAADLSASEAYLQENAATLLTDEAEATLEHLIDINPAADELLEHLELLTMARARGVDTAYAARQEQLLARLMIDTLRQWLDTRTWAESREFAAAHSGELLHPITRRILSGSGDEDPADAELRLHRGLLDVAVAMGLDAAYELLKDTARQRAMIMDPETAADLRLAVGRMHSGLSDDDPEAHFLLAQLTLFAILVRADPLAREAAAVLADCAANAAPYEQRDFDRRFGQLGTDQPVLAPFVAELRPILTARPDANRDQITPGT